MAGPACRALRRGPARLSGRDTRTLEEDAQSRLPDVYDFGEPPISDPVVAVEASGEVPLQELMGKRMQPANRQHPGSGSPY